MVDLLGLHRADDAQVVRDLLEMWEQVGDFESRPAAPAEVAEGAARLELLVLELRELLSAREGLGKRLVMQLLQTGFQSNVSRCEGPPAMHRWMIRRREPGNGATRGRRSIREFPVNRPWPARAGRRGHATQSIGGLVEEGAAIEGLHGRTRLRQYRVTVSWRFRITRASSVQAASSGSSAPVGTGWVPICRNREAAAGSRLHSVRWLERKRWRDPARKPSAAGRARVQRRAGSGRNPRGVPTAAKTFRQSARRFDKGRVVQERQRLLRRVGHRAAGRAFLPRRRIEVGQHRLRNVRCQCVHTTPELLVAGTR